MVAEDYLDFQDFDLPYIDPWEYFYGKDYNDRRQDITGKYLFFSKHRDGKDNLNMIQLVNG